MRIQSTVAVLAFVASACVMNGNSRVGQGQLYSSGRPNYDAYFHDVHAVQVEAATWGDDKRGSHKSLVTALDLTPDASDITIVQAAHERASKASPRPGTLRLEVTGTEAKVAGANGEAPSFFKAIEDAAHAELERAKKMHAIEPRVDALAKTGHDLEPHVQEDFERRGDKKVQEVRGELQASYDALDKVVAQAKRESRESEDFVADLARAIDTAGPGEHHNGGSVNANANASGSSTSTPSKAAPAPKPRRDDTPKPAPAPKPVDSQPAAKPAPAPKPADTGEVFTP